MKTTRLAAFLALSSLLSACAYTPPNQDIARRVSPDYMATGDLEKVRVFVHGHTTLLEFESDPFFLSIYDADGKPVSYEREGQYYRIPSVLDRFTVSSGGSSAVFTVSTQTHIFSAPPAPAIVIPQEAIVMPGDSDLIALVQRSEKQIFHARRLLDRASKDPAIKGDELFMISEHLTKASRGIQTGSATISITFPTGSTFFDPEPDLLELLVSSGKAAERIYLRGYTDSHIAGPLDPQIARGRALSARQFLIENGISPQKISMISEQDSYFTAPSTIEEGRGLNRRVEIEFVNSRIPVLKKRAVR